MYVTMISLHIFMLAVMKWIPFHCQLLCF